ncbi:hypothetical protein [Deinococcus cellulosilyticus]|uniref:Uncharacterized protein n=1 Tax=Deinococcus cellulosilyticus (strain DSM 18568 / NBRC 106333 / KACC 11606 / 5516J-15) TaxID=1223518 RepID=A0A511N758_DEIC1|nr:hypothetical protein [Deinococcus cellulosilyticus]GEM48673.1 hypothetical protein DC3_43080 [Deinococcus cellulosilyticus NBRC 106333 = KACC 11606]
MHPMESLFALQDTLRIYAVWRFGDEGGDAERRRHPRFVAVIEDAQKFQLYQGQAAELQQELQERQMSVRWVPTFFDEVWSHATVTLTQAFRAKRFHDGVVRLALPRVPVGDWSTQLAQWQTKLQEMPAELRVKTLEIEHKELEGDVYPVLQCTFRHPVTVRWESGGSYSLYAVSEAGVQHKDVKVGAVVVRGLQNPVLENLPRKERSDKKPLLFTFCRHQFYL